jgi:hypothetical protein
LRFQNLKRWRLTAEEALATGADRPTFLTIRKDVAGNCTDPIYREYTGAEQITRSRDFARTTRRGPQMTIEFDVRCRVCQNCLKARAAHWRYLCQNELAAAPRSWFVTLTFRPEEHYRVRCAVDLRLLQRGTSMSQASESERFRLLAAECGKEITRYIKRLRKAGARVRYCLVAEAHKSGLPHFHMLLHEVSEDHPVRHKLLADQWGAGFINAKLCNSEDRVAFYVTKYLTKSARARIRASEGYGTAILQSSFIEPKGS